MPPIRNVAANTALAISTCTAQAGRASEERNSSERATKVAMANRRSVRATPSTVTNGTDAPRRRSRTWSVYGVSTVPTRTGTTTLASRPMLVAEKVSLCRARTPPSASTITLRAALRSASETSSRPRVAATQCQSARTNECPTCGSPDRVTNRAIKAVIARPPITQRRAGDESRRAVRPRSDGALRLSRDTVMVFPCIGEWPNMIEAGFARGPPGRAFTGGRRPSDATVPLAQALLAQYAAAKRL